MNKKTNRTLSLVRNQVELFEEMVGSGRLPPSIKAEMELHIQCGREILFLSDKLKKAHVDQVLGSMMDRMVDRMQSHLQPLMDDHVPYCGEWGEA